MKATGIVRKVDELGRVVLPKSLRDRMGIEPGTLLAFSVDDDGLIILEPVTETAPDKRDETLRQLAAICNELADIHTELGRVYSDHGFDKAAAEERGQCIAYRKVSSWLTGAADPAFALQWQRLFLQHEKERLANLTTEDAAQAP